MQSCRFHTMACTSDDFHNHPELPAHMLITASDYAKLPPQRAPELRPGSAMLSKL
ncbi:hypothetical protein M758_4G167300 [Ceratodon purpureus]|uniref:Uncharacterized protein n=1 Tax=Ceratodon purpureus TaxID=3225 RepID=A0A8T0IBL7_CERPU|nr:hypothetical protein KC19_4G165900 [Ceratodon purpureus]KAG0619812.1 hypothetical protein M758_4G167300 [Ceratodon purpureus]